MAEMSEGLREELSYWRDVLAPGKRAEWMEEAIDPSRRQRQSPPRLLDFIHDLQLGRPAKVLDVGSGPLSPLAWAVDGGLIRVTAIDPLADLYAQILHEAGIDYPVKPLTGTGEAVAEMFHPGSFDVVYTRNALDHSISPAVRARDDRGTETGRSVVHRRI